MKRIFFARASFGIIAIALALLVVPGLTFAQVNSGGGFYQQTNLTSSIAGLAKHTDPNLVNPWGISSAPGGPFWISDNNSGKSTLYDNTGTPQSLVVKIPSVVSGTSGSPTGTVFNGDTSAFIVSKKGASGSSIFLFATEDGTISGWSPGVDMTHAILAVNRSGYGTVYKGLAIGTNSSGIFLYATNIHAGTIDVFNAKFALTRLAGSFTDPYLPAGYAPFGIQNINGKLYVTYAKQNAQKNGDVPGPGHGFVDVFDTSGHFIQRLVTRGQLNSPWGLALAGASFGKFSHDFLVGNFGDGHINVFNPTSGAFLGQLTDKQSHPVVIDGLWALLFGLGGQAGNPNQLFFTAGIHQEAAGLFGVIQAM